MYNKTAVQHPSLIIYQVVIPSFPSPPPLTPSPFPLCV